MQEYHQSKGLVAFSLVYLTFFLDNVLLTVLVPIIPDWVQGESLALWTEHGAPLATLLNTTVQRITQEDAGSVGTSQAIVGAVLGAKAATQLVVSPAAAELTAARGPAIALRLATALLATAALVFGWCAGGAGGAGGGGGRGGGAVCAGVGRAAQGAGAALGGVAGLALAARALPADRRDRGLGALLGAVALGVLVGYPFGGTAYKLWSPAAPFQLIAIALLFNLGLQHLLLDKDEYTITDEGGAVGVEGMRREAVRGAAGACAGAVLVTTSVMAALEPCLPLWIMQKFHPERWALGAVFLPDSAGYLLTASSLGGAARRAGPERVAIAAVLVVGVAALVVPHAPSVGWVSVPQAALGAGLGAADAALVPALLASRRRALPHRAALLQAASSAAYAIGPVVGGVGSWCAGFDSALRALGVANLLYAAFLYRALSKHPLSEKWGASTSPDDSDDCAEEMTPLGPTGPGPGAYKLPTTVGFPQHDPSRYRNPMYSFGTNAGFRLKQLGPGPAYRIDKVTREGLTSSPAWSFGARFPTRGTLRTPGPGAHAPERCPPTKEPRAPLYSMGQRLGFELKRPGPAPNAYALHLGSGTPAYTMGLRVGFNLKPKSPGPAVYFQQNADVYKTRPPCYTLGARSAGAGKATRTPGPATYPPNLYNTKKNPYAYSFGTKHGDYAPPMIIKEDTMDCL